MLRGRNPRCALRRGGQSVSIYRYTGSPFGGGVLVPSDFSVIDRRRGLSPGEFQRDYASRGRPVIFEDAARGWHAHQVITPAWLREVYGKKVFPVGDKNYMVGELLDIL